MSDAERPFVTGEVNQARSEAVAKDVGAKRTQCYANSQMAMLLSEPEDSLRGAYYVEGLCLDRLLPTPVCHAWLELDGEIIDPTITAVATRKLRLPDKELARQTRESALREIAAGHRLDYKPIARYTFAEVCDSYLRHGWHVVRLTAPELLGAALEQSLPGQEPHTWSCTAWGHALAAVYRDESLPPDARLLSRYQECTDLSG
jgi:hypothetical protein